MDQKILQDSLMFIVSEKFTRRRKSACADASLRVELERIEQMTVEERVKTALSMRSRFDWLQPVSKAK
ncbi:MAG: hypothetical protein ACSHX7_05575 [Luteolibacter sp.]